MTERTTVRGLVLAEGSDIRSSRNREVERWVRGNTFCNRDEMTL